ncbi:competence protein ComK [Salirhabdus euzebyi]|uniref:Competence protein ComK n=1 Tax=Salirhabdus euzebyi TaxID=394506 RepID=A0A841Q8F3_9BACI|nr:competence protein ComK [Salirhabdus euzebyi]MBB6454557.1 competence protein ComK [Salirhabdus euzebyi]
MTIIQNDYNVNEKTMALIPIFHHEYDTLVLETDRQIHVKKTPLQIIKTACLHNGSSYEGRRDAIIYQTASKRKVPIPINTSNKTFAFPTHSPTQFHCTWIFYNHICHIHPNKTPKTNTSTIMFHNGEQLTLKESHYVMEKQMQRTALCILKFCSF